MPIPTDKMGKCLLASILFLVGTWHGVSGAGSPKTLTVTNKERANLACGMKDVITVNNSFFTTPPGPANAELQACLKRDQIQAAQDRCGGKQVCSFKTADVDASRNNTLCNWLPRQFVITFTCIPASDYKPIAISPNRRGLTRASFPSFLLD